MPTRRRPTLHVTIGLPGVGKTTLARELAVSVPALRFTPDEWMLPLFEGENPEHGRDVLEGRFIATAHEALRLGTSVILDFGCWSAEERWALRAVAEVSGADFVLHPLDLDDDERLARVARRYETTPHETWHMSLEDQAGYRESYTPVGPDEAADRPLPPAPEGSASWLAWASERWSSLPDLSPRARRSGRREAPGMTSIE